MEGHCEAIVGDGTSRLARPLIWSDSDPPATADLRLAALPPTTARLWMPSGAFVSVNQLRGSDATLHCAISRPRGRRHRYLDGGSRGR